MGETNKKDIIKIHSTTTMHVAHAGLSQESKRAAIKAALHAATKDLAATTLKHANFVFSDDPGDGGSPPGGAPPAPPWGEVIIGPIWAEGGGGERREFWEW